jgi:hypothetical protein
MSVSCTSSSSCTAVGFASNGTANQIEGETWDGTNWSVTPTPPSPGSEDNQLLGIDCTSTSSCTAVGFSADSVETDQALIETWNGIAWALTPTPTVAAPTVLGSVSCGQPGQCVAVGDSRTGQSFQNLVETLNRGTWSLTRSPDEPGSSEGMASVSCADANQCVAVGEYNNATVGQQTLILEQ